MSFHLSESLSLLDTRAIDTSQSANHFDFTIPGRRVLVVGPMGSGKTEYSLRIWKDSKVLEAKSSEVQKKTSYGSIDRRKVVCCRFARDLERFPEVPRDALAFRGGHERLGKDLLITEDSFAIEKALTEHPSTGTWIIDEAGFYDERLAFVIRRFSEEEKRVFILPTLLMNFRNMLFNSTSRLLLESATDLYRVSAYCEHPDCVENSYLSYRYYFWNGLECPALYFDPLIMVGGEMIREGGDMPNYCTRCIRHHYLPGKEYTFLSLKPMGLEAVRGNTKALERELSLIKNEKMSQTLLFRDLMQSVPEEDEECKEMYRRALLLPFIAEKALEYLWNEEKLLSFSQVMKLTRKLGLDEKYFQRYFSNKKQTLLE